MLRRLCIALIALHCSVSLGEQPAALPPIAAKSWLLLDVSANQMIASDNVNERIEPASLTKLMTAYVIFGEVRDGRMTINQEVTVSPKAWKTGGSKMFIEPQKKVTVDDLIHGMIVVSGNDAAVALAETSSGSEEAFAQLMNQEAKRLGMTGSNFANASGLPDPNHYTTAYDLGLVSLALIRDFPQFYPIYATKEYKYNNIEQPNRNRLLWLDPNVDGLKTGHTEAAGYCLIASARRGERRMLAVILGAPSESSRAQEAQTLLNFGFQMYDTVKVQEKDKPLSNVRVWKGKANEVRAGLTSDLLVAIPRGTNDKLKADFISTQPLVAPVPKGGRVGTLKVAYDNRPLGEYPVVALDEIPVAGFFGRMWDTMRLWVK
jgi:D-alanyl-D-alanine carboxypeptidase (penicillin-binding protein 5/6)